MLGMEGSMRLLRRLLRADAGDEVRMLVPVPLPLLLAGGGGRRLTVTCAACSTDGVPMDTGLVRSGMTSLATVGTC